MNFNIAHVCLANAQRDEANQTYRYGKRHEKFLNLMEYFKNSTSKPIVVSIKELRKCKDSTGLVELDPNDIINQFALAGKYAVADCQPVKIHKTNGFPTYNPFYLGQIYDNTKLYKIESKIIPYYQIMYESAEAAPHMGGSYLYVKYAFRDDEGFPDPNKTFSVGTVHFPLPETHKLIAAKYFNIDGALLPDILIGDFNLFKDDKLFQDIYCELTKNFIDVMVTDKLLKLTDQNNNKLYGTFYPFPHDNPPIPILPPNVEKTENIVGNHSQLDYVFLNKKSNIIFDNVMGMTNTFNSEKIDEVWSFDSSTFPLSDHLPLVAKFNMQ